MKVLCQAIDGAGKDVCVYFVVVEGDSAEKLEFDEIRGY